MLLLTKINKNNILIIKVFIFILYQQEFVAKKKNNNFNKSIVENNS